MPRGRRPGRALVPAARTSPFPVARGLLRMVSNAVFRNPRTPNYSSFPLGQANTALTNPEALPTITRLVVATTNCGKFAEIVALLQGLRVSILPLDRAGPVQVPPEGGDSFQDNARRKALAVAQQSGYWALADDSGLEVDALGGAPGVRSARFGNPGATDADRSRLLLTRLQGVPLERRTARFRCVMALADSAGRVWDSEGVCEGRIALAPHGVHGFGYDAVFEIPALGCTLAELDVATKNRVSHRGRALAGVREILRGRLDA